MPKQLTVEVLRKLKFKRELFMTMAKEHAITANNRTWGLLISTMSNKRDYKIIERTLTAGRLPNYVCDMLADDLGGELEKFCEAYNAKKG